MLKLIGSVPGIKLFCVSVWPESLFFIPFSHPTIMKQTASSVRMIFHLHVKLDVTWKESLWRQSVQMHFAVYAYASKGADTASPSFEHMHNWSEAFLFICCCLFRVAEGSPPAVTQLSVSGGLFVQVDLTDSSKASFDNSRAMLMCLWQTLC